MKRITSFLIGVFISLVGVCQDVTYAEYFIDSDPGFGQATEIESLSPGQDINLLLNISLDLSPGFHNIGFRSKDAYSWSQTNFASVMIMEDTVYNPISKIEYFWLNDAGFNDPLCSDTIISESFVNLANGKIAVDVPADLPVGNNLLFLRVQDEKGAWSHTQMVGDVYVCSSSFLNYVTETAWCSYTSATGQVYTESGVYRIYVSTPLECDSSYLIDLTINTVDTAIYLEGETLYAHDTTADAYQWLDCGNGNTPVPGADAYMFTPSENGSYAVIVTANDCSDTSNCRQVTIGGISGNKYEVAHIHPNPNNGSFVIEFDKPSNTSTIEIRNSVGVLVLTREISGINKTEISLDEPAGLYFLVIRDAGSAVISKFIIEN